MNIVARHALQIDDARPADLDEIRQLLVTTWHATYDALMGEAVVTEITSRWHQKERLAGDLGSAAFLVARRDGAIVGTALASQASDIVHLHRLYIHPGAQRSGAGTALLRTVVQRFPDAAAIRLEVDPRNERAITFYRRHGFVETGRSSDCGGDSGLPAVVMTRPRPAVSFIRPAVDGDAQDLFGLLSLCFAEYPGCYVDPHDDLVDVLRPQSSSAARGWVFFVVEDGRGRVGACVGYDVSTRGVGELHRLYVRPDMRRQGLARRLVLLCEQEARAAGCTRMVLSSDTRFGDAHRLYESLGYRRGPDIKELNDISRSREYVYDKPLT